MNTIGFVFVYIIVGVVFLLAYFLLPRNLVKDDTEESSSSNSEEVHDDTEESINYENLTYEELLHTPEWYAYRDYILSQRHWTCEWCKSHEKLQVHHRYYLKYPNNKYEYPWNYPDDAVMCLCDDCHKKVHNKYKIRVYYKSFEHKKNFLERLFNY